MPLPRPPTPTHPPPARVRWLMACFAACLLFSAALARAAPGALQAYEPRSADDLLSVYERAQEALSQSLTLVEDAEREAALRSFRRAEEALPILAALLAPSLRAGLETTRARAEEALANGSATDFAVQRAVLGGALGRALYERALEAAAQGDAEETAALLAALERAHGLPAAPRSDRDELRRAFENRLAAHALSALEGLPTGDRDRDYRNLAERYGELLLVQGSPHLPPATVDALLAAVERVVAGTSPEAPLAELREHLAAFAASSAPSPTETSVPVATTPATATEPEVATRREGQGSTTSSTPPTTPAPTVPTTAPTATTGTFEARVLSALLTLFGLLVLLALAQAAKLALAGQHPLHNLAVALLLLPALLESVAALAPLSGWSALAPLEGLSLQHRPAQLLWVLLVALAIFCLAIGWRRAAAPHRASPHPARRTATPPAATLARTELDWGEDF
jgi:hypothetical protein